MSDGSDKKHEGPGMQYEIRLYGLHPTITSDQLIAFFSFGVRVLGVVLQPGQEGLQWAKLWVGSEREAEICLEKKVKLAENGITITRAPDPSGWMTPESTRKSAVPPVPLNSPVQLDASHARYRSTSSSLSLQHLRGESGGLGYRHVDPSGPLPRNLYVMGLPLDLTQVQFKALFTAYGMVEHSILLSQLDSMGRRRGFVLMSTHREALAALNGMNETSVEGLKIDVSWALRQKEAQQIGAGMTGLGNRVLHPPTTPVRKESSADCAVVCDNLDPAYFPHIDRLRDVLEVYGPINRVTLLSARPSLKVLIQFDHAVSAQALISSSGASIAGRSIITYPYSPSTTSSSALITPHTHSSPRAVLPAPSIPKAFQFDPFNDQESAPSDHRLSQLNATSVPFVPPSSSLTKPRFASSSSENQQTGSAALSRISSRSNSTGNSTPAHAAGANVRMGMNDLRLAEIWH